MIITRPILQRFSPAIQEAQPQVDDAILQIPPFFNLVGIPPEPIRRLLITGLTSSTSSVVQANGQVANAGQQLVQIMKITPGWWRIFISLAYRSNYVLATATPGNFRVLLEDIASNFQLITAFAQLSGSQNINLEQDYLFTIDTTITTILDTNGVGQEHTYSGSFCAQRLL